MNYKGVIVKLYYQLINSDGKVNEHEVSLGKKMMEVEKISVSDFHYYLESFKKKDLPVIYKETISDLKRLTLEQQVRCLAWLCVLANSDGFMDKAEWQFIYKIYHKELNLPLAEIMEVQKELVKKLTVTTVSVEWTSSTPSMSRMAS
ncbi:MAG: TerB family tellurite resistance protein [Chryseolinea sp.]